MGKKYLLEQWWAVCYYTVLRVCNVNAVFRYENIEGA